MAHLTFDEILYFVGINELNKENLDLIAKVGHHVAECAECDKFVASVQEIYKEFVRLGKKSQFSKNALTLADIGIADMFDSGEQGCEQLYR